MKTTHRQRVAHSPLWELSLRTNGKTNGACTVRERKASAAEERCKEHMFSIAKVGWRVSLPSEQENTLLSLSRGTSFRTKARGWHGLVSEGRTNNGNIQVYLVHFTVLNWPIYKGRWCEKLVSECLSRERIFTPLHVTAESIGARGGSAEYAGNMEALTGYESSH